MIYTIRKAETKDAKKIFDFLCMLENVAFDFNLFNLIYCRNIENENNYYFVAQEQQELIGYLSCHTQWLLHHCSMVGEIQELFVEEAFRKNKIGSLLLDALIKILKENGCNLLEVTANNHRIHSHQFYLQMGFSQTHQKFSTQIL